MCIGRETTSAMRFPSAKAIENGTPNGTVAVMSLTGFGTEALAIILRAPDSAVKKE